MNNFYLIKWPRTFTDTFNDGSLISFDGEQVTFSNSIMSPGNEVHTWYSKIRGDQWQQLPSLPLLKTGTRYYFSLNLKQKPANSVHVLIRFFDGEDDLLKRKVFKSSTGSFEYPDGAQSYSISLLSMNNKLLTFTNLVLANANPGDTFSQHLYRNFKISFVKADKLVHDGASLKIVVSLRQERHGTVNYQADRRTNTVFVEFTQAWVESDKHDALVVETVLTKIKQIVDGDLHVPFGNLEFEIMSQRKILEQAADIVSMLAQQLKKMQKEGVK